MELIVMLLYLVCMFAIGFYFKNRVKGTEDFFLSSRSLPWFVITLTFAATYIGAASTLAKSGIAYNLGYQAITVTIAPVLAMYGFSYIAPRIRKIGVLYNVGSIPELFYRRFGKTASLIAAVIILWTLVGTVGSQMVAASRILEVICEPWGVSYEIAAAISVVIMVAYTMFSGLYGVAYTDVVQGLIVLIMVGVGLPILAINSAGGWAHIRTVLPPENFSFQPNMEIIGFMWVYGLYFLSGPPYWQRAFASGSEKGARRGVFSASTVILLYTVMVTLIGMAAAVIYPTFPEGAHESLIPIMVRDLYHPFLAALVIVAIMAILMSTIDSYLINAAQTAISDIYRRIKNDVTEAEQLRLAKWVVVFLGCASIVFALNIRVIMDAIIFAMTFYSASLAVPSIAALCWRKATKEGVIAGMFTGIIVATLWSNVLHSPNGLHQAIPGGILCLLVTVFVSLVTYKPETAAPFLEINVTDIDQGEAISK
ncbi:MAG: sodium:solute symporter family protein [Dethiobacteria bacterium]|jgi:SSS family solute:Na+ symporter